MITIPKVSVIVPIFNEIPERLEASLGSIMSQTFADFECIVVDDSTWSESYLTIQRICSRDERFRHIRPSTRLGIAGSLNLGISLARGELIARFDSDDISMHDRLALQTSFMDLNPHVGVLGGSIEVIDDLGNTIRQKIFATSHREIARKMQVVNALAHPTVLFRSHIGRVYGFYNETYRHCEDLELWLRWVNGGVIFANLADILIKYRSPSNRHPDNWRYNLKARIENFSNHFMAIRVIGLLCVAALYVMPKPIEMFLYGLARNTRLGYLQKAILRLLF